MTRKDVLIIQAPFLMTKENIEKTYNQFIKQMESGLLMLPSGYTVIQCPKDIDVKFSGDAISREWLKTAIHKFYYGLNHTPTEEDIQAYIDAAPSVSYSEKPNKCGDAISRQAVLNIDFNRIIHATTLPSENIKRAINDLPPVSVAKKTGQWEWVQYDFDVDGLPIAKHCPNRGCRMMGVEE